METMVIYFVRGYAIFRSCPIPIEMIQHFQETVDPPAVADEVAQLLQPDPGLPLVTHQVQLEQELSGTKFEQETGSAALLSIRLYAVMQYIYLPSITGLIRVSVTQMILGMGSC